MFEEADIVGHSIVLVGVFTPQLFTPTWFRQNNLIGQAEANEANINILFPGASNFATESISFEANPRALQVATAMPDTDRLKELMVGLLTILTDAPVSALGINTEIHWRPESDAFRHQFGDALVPKDPWLAAGLILPGTLQVSVQGVRSDNWQGAVNVTVQPSVRVAGGLFAGVNDHFDLQRVDRQPASRDDFNVADLARTPVTPDIANRPLALEILKDQWIMSNSQAAHIIAQLIALSNSDRHPQR